jgi:hypothetical protein
MRQTVRTTSGLGAILVIALACQFAWAQSDLPEKSFPESKAAIELALKKLQPSLAGRLPVLDGFVAASDQPLERYRRAYFQTAVQVTSTSSSTSAVRATTKITAWYTDPTGAHSGYRLLPSNGRLESDLLEQLSDELASKTKPAPAITAKVPDDTVSRPTEPPKSIPSPKTPAAGSPFSQPLSPSLPARDESASIPKNVDKDLEAEIKNLREVLRNQGHPKNLAAVKESRTPVVASPSLTAKPLFLASAHDEFEMLDFNADWVHVRISGLSRGWIWRNSLEMPDEVPDTAARSNTGAKAAAEQLFHVTREEAAAFPGDWQALRGKNVRIISIEKTDEKEADVGVTMRLEFAKSILDKNYADLTKKGDALAGIVLIFDSADGGMIAATVPSLQQWKAGSLSDSAFWKQCLFDPPEMLGGSTPASQ